MKPSKFTIVGPTLARPGSLRSVPKCTVLGRPGPPIAMGTCARTISQGFSQRSHAFTHRSAADRDRDVLGEDRQQSTGNAVASCSLGTKRQAISPTEKPQVRQAQGKTLTGLSVWEVSMRGLPSSMSGFFVFLSRCTMSSACPFHCNVLSREGKPPSNVPLAWLHSIETGT